MLKKRTKETLHTSNMETEKAPKSAEIVGSIDHLLSTILLLLPVKSLLRFKSVSKDWLYLISNPLFCHLHNPNPNPAVGLLLPPAGDHQSFEYVPFSTHRSTDRKLELNVNLSGTTILQSCNGLLLLGGSNCRYYVYNPTTNCRSELPEPDEKTGGFSEIRGMSLVFDPFKSHSYNVVCIFPLPVDSSEFVIGIFSSETGSWRLCGGPFAGKADFGNGVYWNGAVHWVGIRNGEESLYFNVADQVLDKMPMLPFFQSILPIRGSRSDYFFGHSCDHLYFIEKPGSTVRFNVYEMRRDYSEWFVKYQVDLSPVVAANREMVLGSVSPMGWYSLVFSVFGVIHGQHEEDSFLVLQTPEKIIRYNIVSKTFENLYKFQGSVAKGSLRYPRVGGFEYSESLCCV